MMQLVCPMDWDALDPSADPAIRHCNQCDQDVHLCTTADQFIERAKHNECVALSASLHVPDGASTKVQMVGRPAPWSYQLESSAAQFWLAIQKDAPELGSQMTKELEKCRTRRILRTPDDSDPV